jgi:hypothetical protein
MGKVTYSLPLLLLAALAALISACGGGVGGGYGGGSSSGTMTGAISTIAVTPATASVAKGAMQQFMATAKDSNGNVISGVSFNWASSASGVATVNSGGLATAVTDGSTMITASFTYSGGVYTTPVTITSNAATLTVTGSVSVSGTAAMGQAVAHGTVSLRDANNQFASATTDEMGRFSVPVSGMTAPFLLRLDDGQGHVLFGLARSVGTANIHPYSDLLVRQLFAEQQTTPEAAFADLAHHPVSVDEAVRLDTAMVSSLSDALSRHGIDPSGFSLLSTPFNADHTGFDAVLDERNVDTASGRMKMGMGGQP